MRVLRGLEAMAESVGVSSRSQEFDQTPPEVVAEAGLNVRLPVERPVRLFVPFVKGRWPDDVFGPFRALRTTAGALRRVSRVGGSELGREADRTDDAGGGRGPGAAGAQVVEGGADFVLRLGRHGSAGEAVGDRRARRQGRRTGRHAGGQGGRPVGVGAGRRGSPAHGAGFGGAVRGRGERGGDARRGVGVRAPPAARTGGGGPRAGGRRRRGRRRRRLGAAAVRRLVPEVRPRRGLPPRGGAPVGRGARPPRPLAAAWAKKLCGMPRRAASTTCWRNRASAAPACPSASGSRRPARRSWAGE